MNKKRNLTILLSLFAFSCFSQSTSWQHGYTVGKEYRQTLLMNAPVFNVQTNLNTAEWYVNNAFQALATMNSANPVQNTLGYNTDIVQASGASLNFAQDSWIETILRNIYIEMLNGIYQLVSDDPNFDSIEYALGFDFGLFE